MTARLITATPTEVVWRIGYPPSPWAWVPRDYFTGENCWDDQYRDFRTCYAGSRYGCFVEVLAQFRPDRLIHSEFDQIEEEYPLIEPKTSPLGVVPHDWRVARRIAKAHLDGEYVDVTASSTIAVIRRRFITFARELGYVDVDAAAVKRASPRDLTRSIASWLYKQVTTGAGTYAGVRFASRHGDELVLWAIFERDGDHPYSRYLTIAGEPEMIAHDDSDLLRAFDLHGLR